MIGLVAIIVFIGALVLLAVLSDIDPPDTPHFPDFD